MEARKHVAPSLFLIVTSLLIAFVIWMIAKRSDMVVETVSVEAQLVNVPENVRAEIENPRVQVSLTMPRAVSALALSASMELTVDWMKLAETRGGVGVDDFRSLPPHPLDLENLRFEDELHNRARQIQIARLDPPAVVVRARYLTHPARPDFRTTGTLPGGYRLAEPISSSAGNLLLTASAKLLEELAPEGGGPIPLPAEPIDLTGRRSSFTEWVRLQLPEEAQLVEVEARVEAQVQIEEVIIARDVANVPVALSALDESLEAKFDVKRVTVSVRGPERIVRDLESEDLVARPIQAPREEVGLEAVVELRGVFTASAPSEAPDHVDVLSVEPASIRVQYQLRLP